MAWLSAILTAFKMFFWVIDTFKKTPAEKRRASMNDLDTAIKKATVDGDLTHMSKWLGGKV